MEQKSILEGITEHDVVTVHNPLSDKFVGKVARSVVTRRPGNPQQHTGNSTADAFLNGIQSGIVQGGHQSMAHVQQTIEFKAGQTLRLPGDVARVVVRQIVKEMMQRSKQKKLMADPHAFMECERRVVLNHESMLSNLSVETVEERLQRQLNEMNPTHNIKAEENEQAFPTEQPRSFNGDNPAGADVSGEPAKVAARTGGVRKQDK